jgi:hypothetical protein
MHACRAPARGLPAIHTWLQQAGRLSLWCAMVLSMCLPAGGFLPVTGLWHRIPARTHHFLLRRCVSPGGASNPAVTKALLSSTRRSFGTSRQCALSSTSGTTGSTATEILVGGKVMDLDEKALREAFEKSDDDSQVCRAVALLRSGGCRLLASRGCCPATLIARPAGYGAHRDRRGRRQGQGAPGHLSLPPHHHPFALLPQQVYLSPCAAPLVPALTSSAPRRIIRAECVTVNGKTPKPAAKLRAGDCVVVSLPPPPGNDVAGEDIPLSILYEDDQAHPPTPAPS